MATRTLLIACSLLLLACSDETVEPQPDVGPTGTWVGEINENDAWVAVTYDGKTAVAFVCGGSTTLTTHTQFMFGASGVDVSLSEGGTSLTTTIADGAISGTVQDSAGASLTFTAAQPSLTTAIYGLFTAVDSGCRDGVIVQGPTLTQGAWCDDMGNVAPISPSQAATLQGFDVVATAPGGTQMFRVEPVVPRDFTL